MHKLNKAYNEQATQVIDRSLIARAITLESKQNKGSVEKLQAESYHCGVFGQTKVVSDKQTLETHLHNDKQRILVR